MHKRYHIIHHPPRTHPYLASIIALAAYLFAFMAGVMGVCFVGFLLMVRAEFPPNAFRPTPTTHIVSLNQAQIDSIASTLVAATVQAAVPTSTQMPTATRTPLPSTDTPTPFVTNTLVPTPVLTDTPTPTPFHTLTAAPALTSTPTDTPTALPPSPTVVVRYQSGGIGLSRVEWRRDYAAIDDDELGYTPVGVGYRGRDQMYDVVFMDGNVWRIARQWPTSGFVSPEVAEELGRQLFPSDALFIRTYSPEQQPHTIVHVYFSESIVDRFDAELWSDSEPGTVEFQYTILDGLVSHLIAGIDDNP